MRFRDPRLDEECPAWGSTDAQAAARVFGDLTAHAQRPIDQIAHEYWQYRGTKDLAAQQRVAQATEEAAVLDYYAATPHYLYELSYWEACHDKQMWFRVLALACRKYQLRRLLDFGGGVGGLCLYLNMRGIRCEYLDVRGKTFEYSSWRFARHHLTIPMYDVTSNGQPSEGCYDGIVVWDVLEHLFDLEGAVRRIIRLLRPGGWLMSKSTFAVAGGRHEAIHLAQHACYADVAKLNALFASHGLRYRGQLKPNRPSRLLRTLRFRHAVAGVRIVPRLKHGGNFLVHEKVRV